jgi:hypothetical protein
MLCEPACPSEQRFDVQYAYDDTWKVMNDAQITVYSVDLRLASSRTLAADESTFTHPYDIGDAEFDNAANPMAAGRD